MAFQEGEIYQCPDPNCGCELTITKTAAPDRLGHVDPTCSCGKLMEPLELGAGLLRGRRQAVYAGK